MQIYKSGAKHDPNNYRGISLAIVLYQIFSVIVNKRLYLVAYTFELVDENQAGFCCDYSVIDNLFVLQSMVKKYICEPRGRF